MSEKFHIDFNSSMIKTGIFCAGLGFIISLLFSVFGGNSLAKIILKPMVFGLLLGAVGMGIYLLLQALVPDLLNDLRGESPETGIAGPAAGPGAEGDDLPFAGNTVDSGSMSSLDDLSLDKNDMAINDAPPSAAGDEQILAASSVKEKIMPPRPKKTVAKEGEILAEGIAIKNDPDMMAKTIQHMLDKDE